MGFRLLRPRRALLASAAAAALLLGAGTWTAVASQQPAAVHQSDQVLDLPASPGSSQVVRIDTSYTAALAFWPSTVTDAPLGTFGGALGLTILGPGQHPGRVDFLRLPKGRGFLPGAWPGWWRTGCPVAWLALHGPAGAEVSTS